MSSCHIGDARFSDCLFNSCQFLVMTPTAVKNVPTALAGIDIIIAQEVETDQEITTEEFEIVFIDLNMA